MSTHFQVQCPICRVEGPDVRRQAGGVNLNGEDEAWIDFLLEHEWCSPLLLVHEASMQSMDENLRNLGMEAKPAFTPPPPHGAPFVSIVDLWRALGRDFGTMKDYPDLNALVAEILRSISEARS